MHAGSEVGMRLFGGVFKQTAMPDNNRVRGRCEGSHKEGHEQSE